MTQEEILEFNKRCAEFLTIGSAYFPDEIEATDQKYSPLCTWANTSYALDKDDNPNSTVYDYLKFHSDWNWIMEVVEAIEKLGFNCEVSTDSCTIHSCLGKEVFETYAKFRKQAIVQAINQFLIWYKA